MAIFYNKIQRRNPSLKKDETKLWYPVLRRVDQVKEKEVAKQIADETTLNPKEAEMAVAQLKKVLINALTNGNSVQLGDWGSFYLSISSKGSEKEDDVRILGLTKREKAQRQKFLEDNAVFFFNDENVSEEDKDKLMLALNNAYFRSKEIKRDKKNKK